MNESVLNNLNLDINNGIAVDMGATNKRAAVIATIPSGDRISQNEENVKTKLEDRVSGDDLFNAQDLIEEIESVGGAVDENGYVTVYHRTTENAKQKILSTGKMSTKEDGVFFSTKREGQAEGYGSAVVEMKIPVERLVLDDIFDDEAHLRILLKIVTQRLMYLIILIIMKTSNIHSPIIFRNCRRCSRTGS